MFKNAKPGDLFINRAGDIVTFLGVRDDNGEYRYRVRQSNGDRSYHNAAGEMPLNYDPGSFVARPYATAALVAG